MWNCVAERWGEEADRRSLERSGRCPFLESEDLVMVLREELAEMRLVWSHQDARIMRERPKAE